MRIGHRASSASISGKTGIPAEQARSVCGPYLAMGDVASYITVNVSSPNTPGLRSLQMSDELSLLKAVKAANEQLRDGPEAAAETDLVRSRPISPARRSGGRLVSRFGRRGRHHRHQYDDQPGRRVPENTRTFPAD
ncbi:MAG: hypothetical protein R2849_20000 [Thermomicrobiales bacterium]